MGEGFNVRVEQIRAHAAKVEEIQTRFDAVQGASGHIAQDDQAYGLLCGWISGISEGRHSKQDELIAFVAENLRLAAESLRAVAEDYQGRDDEHAAMIESSGGVLP